jgi:translation initiation factor 2 subunit 2
MLVASTDHDDVFAFQSKVARVDIGGEKLGESSEVRPVVNVWPSRAYNPSSQFFPPSPEWNSRFAAWIMIRVCGIDSWKRLKYREGGIVSRVTKSDNYDQLLDRALAGITTPGTTGERFELPIASVSVIGARTIVHNFADVADRLNRDPLHILKYLAKEMATAGSFEGGKGYFQGKFSRDTINRLVGAYSNRFVICPVCHRPDTRVERRDRLSFLVCEACGARSSILTT